MEIIWINYIGMNEYLFRSTIKCRKYNKMGMDEDDDEDGADASVDDGDDAQASKYLSSGEDQCPSASTPPDPFRR